MGNNIAMEMKAVRDREAAFPTSQSAGVSDRMIESVRQSLKVEGYDVPDRTIRDAAEQTIAIYE